MAVALLATRLLAAHEAEHVDSIVIVGNQRTRDETVLELLPRRPPTRLSEAELGEFRRRLDNLAIFDAVTLERRGRTLRVGVREKWTLIPSLEFASGSSIEDTYALLGVTDFSFLGTGNQLMVAAARAQRGYFATIEYREHVFRRTRWALDAALSGGRQVLRFDDGSEWATASAGLAIGASSPPWPFQSGNYHVGAYYQVDRVTPLSGEVRAPDAHGFGSNVTFSWNGYQWADLVPRGAFAGLTAGAGIFTGETVPQARHLLQLELQGALPLAKHRVLMSRMQAGLTTRGNANFSQELGSIMGVRGLRDTFYRNWAQAFCNVELRRALPLAERWALQLVLFGDTALFEQIDARGQRGAASSALSAGGGIRLVPTWLASSVLRVDGSYLFTQQTGAFLQLGLNQYF
ncbi:MAG: hypothetical protein QM756_09460 [Polyangiaceae bacterium]